MSEASPACSLRGISKAYGRHQVLRDLSLEISSGEVILLLGANGSGKTTLLRICAGLCRPDTGRVDYLPPGSGGGRRRPIAHTGHQLFLYGGLTVVENIRLFLRIAGSPRLAEEAIEEWGLSSRMYSRVSELSKGEQMRASLCRAFLGDPSVFLLDEPTSPLDENAARLLLARVRKGAAQAGGFALIATHDVMRLKEWADRIVVLQGGAIAGDLAQTQRERPHAGAEELKGLVISQYLAGNR